MCELRGWVRGDVLSMETACHRPLILKAPPTHTLGVQLWDLKMRERKDTV